MTSSSDLPSQLSTKIDCLKHPNLNVSMEHILFPNIPAQTETNPLLKKINYPSHFYSCIEDGT